MRLHFNAPLKYDRERNGYFFDTKDDEIFELPGVWFNATELTTWLFKSPSANMTTYS